MSTLIAYASKYGCTERCAQKLAQVFSGKVDLLDLKSGKSADLSQYNKIIIGSSVYVGKVHKEAADFCINNLENLRAKKVGLFICGTQEGEPLKQELDSAYPEELQLNAVARVCFGGEFTFSKMNFFEKAIVKLIAKTNKDTSTIKEDIINNFARTMKDV